MKILVTGADGQLGHEMQTIASRDGANSWLFTDVAELDLCDTEAVRR